MTLREQMYLEDKRTQLQRDLDLLYKTCPIGKVETDFNEVDTWFEETKVLEELISFINEFVSYASEEGQ